MTSVLMVCLGNICRSPMAEGVLRAHLERRGLADRVRVDSAGTGGWHVGEPPDPRTLAELRRNGIRLARVARQLRPEDGDAFEWILAMDHDNLQVTRRVVGPRRADRVHLALDPTGGGAVPDPYYGGPEGFTTVFRLLDTALARWVDRIAP